MPVRALVITSTVPPVAKRDVEGYYKRLSVFMGAIGSVADQVEVVHLVPQDVITANPDATTLNHIQERYWGFPVSVRMIERRERDKTFFNYYVRGIFSAAEQPWFSGSPRAEQTALLRDILGQGHDLVFIHRFTAMCALLRTRRRNGNVVFDLDDVEHRVRLRAGLQQPIQPGKLLTLAHVPAVLAAERLGAARSQLTFVCSETDRRKLRKLGIARGVTVVPNAVPMPSVPMGMTREPNILFIGDYGYEPNKEAAERLATRILPRIRQGVPDARLLLVGKRAERLSRAVAAEPGVECLGFVEDLDGLYARIRVVCCPIINGGGTRLKLIEGAAYGRPLVSTRVGAEGLAFDDGVEILLADDDAGLASACERLMHDDALCERIGDAARRRALQDYRADHIKQQVARLLQGVVDRGRTGANPRALIPN
jgi:glycosyltransferase involved in cell wall biosynthesis